MRPRLEMNWLDAAPFGGGGQITTTSRCPRSCAVRLICAKLWRPRIDAGHSLKSTPGNDIRVNAAAGP